MVLENDLHGLLCRKWHVVDEGECCNLEGSHPANF